MKSLSPAFLPVVACLGIGLGLGQLPSHAESAPAALVERQAQVNKVMQTSAKAVVGIAGVGSGVITSKDGVILTAAHVLDAFIDPRTGELIEEPITIVLADGKLMKAKILGRNRDRDAAMAKIIDGADLPFVELADPKSIKEGDWCVAMGHPGGYQRDRTAPVRLGRVWDRDEKKYFRSDCTVSGGDSGGPLFNMEGKLIGIHSNIGERLDENRHVPIGAFNDSWERLAKGDAWGNLGKLMPELAPYDMGGGKDKSGSEKSEKDAPKEPKSDKMKDSDKPKESTEKKAEPKPSTDEKPQPRPSGSGKPSLGVALSDTAEAPTVASVRPDSAAAKAGIESGDVILSIAGKEVGSVSELIEQVMRTSPGAKVKVKLKRGEQSKELEVTMGQH